jgi:MFS family permease
MTVSPILAGCVAISAVSWDFANLGAVADPIARSYGVGLPVVGLMTTALVAAHAIVNIPGGRGVDRFGPRRTALAGLVLVAFSNCLLLLAHDPGLAIAARGLMGVGTACTFVAAIDYVRTLGGGTSLAPGLVGGAAVAGSGLALATVPQVEPLLGWRASGITGLAAALVAIAVFSRGPLPVGTSYRLADQARIRDLLADTRLYRLGAMHAASMGISLIVANWIVVLLVRYHGYGQGAAGALGSLTLLLGGVARPAAGWLARKRPEATRALLASSLLVGAAATAVLASAPAPALAAPAAIFVGLAAGVPFGPVMHASATTRPDAPAAAVGFTNACGNVMLLVGTPLVGLSFSQPGGGRAGFAFLAALWGLAVLALPSRQELAGTPEPALAAR